MKISALKFEDFSINQLYAVLRLRSEVFVVEQDCVYQDIDNKDQRAIHILATVDAEIVAYTRFFKQGDYVEHASIGRVVVHPKHRHKAYGKLIMKESIYYAQDQGYDTIQISAQCYLDKFYQDLGFKNTGKKYLEDGITHQEMIFLSREKKIIKIIPE